MRTSSLLAREEEEARDDKCGSGEATARVLATVTANACVVGDRTAVIVAAWHERAVSRGVTAAAA